MDTIKVKQVKSRINSSEVQKRTLDALGLTKMNKVVEHVDTPTLRGLINRVQHLVEIVD
ncbi:MAG: 50S ribosomal protein L30 [Proteiniphilum sp.]|nr:50S ribosomal protein L30 [Proteiniphilum sp.]